jgi:hypothetical protein
VHGLRSPVDRRTASFRANAQSIAVPMARR